MTVLDVCCWQMWKSKATQWCGNNTFWFYSSILKPPGYQCVGLFAFISSQCLNATNSQISKASTSALNVDGGICSQLPHWHLGGDIARVGGEGTGGFFLSLNPRLSGGSRVWFHPAKKETPRSITEIYAAVELLDEIREHQNRVTQSKPVQ